MDSLGLNAFDADLSEVDTPDLPDAVDTPAEDTPPAAEAAAGDETPVETPDEQPAAKVEGEADPKEAAAALAAAAIKAKEGDKAAQAAKVLKFKTDSGLIDVAEAAEVDWKVDGKVEKVKVRELLDNYAGKVSYDRKFQELAGQRKGFTEEAAKFESTRERHKALINDMHKAASEGRVFDAVANMLEMTGLSEKVNPRKYISELRESLVKHAQALAGMSPEQRKIAELQEEQDYQNAKYTRLDQQREAEQAEKAYHERVTKAIDSVKSSPEEFVQTRDFMVNFYKSEGKDPSTITPEAIATQIRDVRDYGLVKRAMEAVSPELVKNQQLWQWAVDTFRANPKWTEEDVKGIFQKAVGAERSKAISAKIAKQPFATAAKGAVKSKAVKQTDPDDYTSFSKDEVAW